MAPGWVTVSLGTFLQPVLIPSFAARCGATDRKDRPELSGPFFVVFPEFREAWDLSSSGFETTLNSRSVSQLEGWAKEAVLPVRCVEPV